MKTPYGYEWRGDGWSAAIHNFGWGRNWWPRRIEWESGMVEWIWAGLYLRVDNAVTPPFDA